MENIRYKPQNLVETFNILEDSILISIWFDIMKFMIKPNEYYIRYINKNIYKMEECNLELDYGMKLKKDRSNATTYFKSIEDANIFVSKRFNLKR